MQIGSDHESGFARRLILRVAISDDSAGDAMRIVRVVLVIEAVVVVNMVLKLASSLPMEGYLPFAGHDSASKPASFL